MIEPIELLKALCFILVFAVLYALLCLWSYYSEEVEAWEKRQLIKIKKFVKKVLKKY